MHAQLTKKTILAVLAICAHLVGRSPLQCVLGYNWRSCTGGQEARPRANEWQFIALGRVAPFAQLEDADDESNAAGDVCRRISRAAALARNE